MKWAVLAGVLALPVTAGIVVAAQQPARPPSPPRPPVQMPKQPGHGSGKLVIWGDIASFQPRGHPDNCLTMNRFKRGEPVGFRMTAIDGGTGETEHTAQLTVHIVYGGRTVDVPMRYRGENGASVPPPSGYLRPPVDLWTGRWDVPADAPIAMLSYTVSAKDAFGRTTLFTPFPFSSSQLTIVE